jgi:hypothetical protein
MTMLDDDLARLRACRNNIHRYRRLLGTKLSEIERQFVERRLGEEEAALENLKAGSFPLAFTAGRTADSRHVGPLAQDRGSSRVFVPLGGGR